MLNLLFNACEAVPPDSGKIDITGWVSERGIEIRVADNGSGIPDSIRENLFQPFVSYGKAKGIGLGLTAVHKIMQDHGGEVSVESTGPHGTVFRLRIPVTVPAGLVVSVPIARESLHSRMRERPSPL
jgi:signal transduction histidine kinase